MTSHALQMHGGDDYLIGKRGAWFAFAMTIGLMLVDYIDRQVIVSLFPYMKLEWGLSDKQLGALVSVVSITVALGAFCSSPRCPSAGIPSLNMTVFSSQRTKELFAKCS